MATVVRFESAIIAFRLPTRAATTTTTSIATAWPADNHGSTNSWLLRADQPIQHHQRQTIYLRNEGLASTLKELASPPPPPTPPNNLISPPSSINVNCLCKTDPLVLAMVLRCGCEETTTPSPTRMLHSTPSTDEQRYLPKTTATSGSGLQNETPVVHSGPLHSEPASSIYQRLHPTSS